MRKTTKRRSSVRGRAKVGAHGAAATAAAGIQPLAVAPKVAFGMLGVGVTHGYELINTGALSSFPIGRCPRIPLKSIEAYIERQLAEAKAARPKAQPAPRTLEEGAR